MKMMAARLYIYFPYGEISKNMYFRWICFCLSPMLVVFFNAGECDAALQMWEPIKYHTIEHPETKAIVNVTYARFKKLPGPGSWSISHIEDGCSFDNDIAQKCSNNCFDTENCITWSFNKLLGMCRCYPQVFRAHSLTVIASKDWTSFEMKNPCVDNLNLCEHGSTCVPDRLTRTYECINCFPPYTGPHCNLTGPVTPLNVDPDILFGRNRSCAALVFNFNIPLAWGNYWIHPWRDERKIKVACFGSEMNVTYMLKEEPLVRELKADDLDDGLDLTYPSYRAHTLFLNKLEKLIHFDVIVFGCDRGDLRYTLISKMGDMSNNYYDFLPIRYFTGNTDTRPDKVTMGLEGSSVRPLRDEKYSIEDIEVEERTFKDIYNGRVEKFTFTNESKLCFSRKEDDYVFFTVRIL